MRVLATFPDLSEPSATPAVAVAAVAPCATTAAGDPEPPQPARPAPHRPIRRTARPSFPLLSAAALALITAVIWSLVAVREAAQPGPRQPAARIAAEAPAAGEAVR